MRKQHENEYTFKKTGPIESALQRAAAAVDRAMDAVTRPMTTAPISYAQFRPSELVEMRDAVLADELRAALAGESSSAHCAVLVDIHAHIPGLNTRASSFCS